MLFTAPGATGLTKHAFIALMIEECYASENEAEGTNTTFADYMLVF